MHIAIIGAGISGLTIAMLLSKKHKVTLYEANNYLGGHACTLNEKILVNNKFTDIKNTINKLVSNNLNTSIVIDCSHGNSKKQFKNNCIYYT